MLKLTSYYLIFLQAIKLALIPYFGVDFWIIDGFHHAFYTYFPLYPGWGGKWLVNPYSFFWQLWYLPTALIGWLPFMWLMWCFDSIILIVTVKYQSPYYALAFSLSSFFLFSFSIEDLFCFWLAVIGKEKWPMSVFAAIVKLPTLAPGYVWQFIIYTSIGSQTDIISNPLGLPRYIFLGIWIIHPFFYWIKPKIRKWYN